mgnify:CR=1 FL=1
MGLGNFFGDVLGFDPNGGGIYNVANDILGDTIADDWLGLDPNGGGIVGAINAAAPMVAAYFGGQFIPGFSGTEAMGPMTEAEMGSSFAGDMASAGYPGTAAGTAGTTAAMEGGFGGGTITPETAALGADAINTATNVPNAAAVTEAFPYASGPNAMGPQTAANLGEGFNTAMTQAGVESSPTLGGMFQKGWNAVNSPLWSGGPSARQGLSGMQLAGNLYSMYAKNQMAKAQQNQANQVQNQINQINSMYAPGSPEYNRMMNEIARKDAAAGRNSQYGVRAQNLAGIIAQQKASMMPGITNLTSQTQALQSAANKDRYGALASLFANAGALNAPKAVDTTGGV